MAKSFESIIKSPKEILLFQLNQGINEDIDEDVIIEIILSNIKVLGEISYSYEYNKFDKSDIIANIFLNKNLGEKYITAFYNEYNNEYRINTLQNCILTKIGINSIENFQLIVKKLRDCDYAGYDIDFIAKISDFIITDNPDYIKVILANNLNICGISGAVEIYVDKGIDCEIILNFVDKLGEIGKNIQNTKQNSYLNHRLNILEYRNMWDLLETNYNWKLQKSSWNSRN